MVVDFVFICLSLFVGDCYMLWVFCWWDVGDEWEVFLGKDDDLYGFESVFDLVVFVCIDIENDLVDYLVW